MNKSEKKVVCPWKKIIQRGESIKTNNNNKLVHELSDIVNNA